MFTCFLVHHTHSKKCIIDWFSLILIVTMRNHIYTNVGNDLTTLVADSDVILIKVDFKWNCGIFDATDCRSVVNTVRAL